jgi:hypothetical protein
MRFAWLLGLAAACSDKTVDLALLLPSSQVAAEYDTSCVSAVRLYLVGKDYPTTGDYTTGCYDLPPGTPNATFAQVRDAIAGRFEVDVPPSGLATLELYAHNGTCTASREYDFDLTFYAETPFIGQDPIELPVIPNLSCATSSVTVRAIDVLALVETNDCAMATWQGGRVALSTAAPLPSTSTTLWWGGQINAPVVDGVATLTGSTKTGPNTCLAIGFLDNLGFFGFTCVAPAEQRVCAQPGELEAPMVDYDLWNASLDLAKENLYGGMIIGAVMGSGGPVSGATVALDEPDQAKGQVVYLDPPIGDGGFVERPDSATGPSGLFAIYTRSPVRMTITGNGTTVRRRAAAVSTYAGAMLVKL